MKGVTGSNPILDESAGPEGMSAYLLAMGKAARSASRILAESSTAVRNQALQVIAERLVQQTDALMAANAKDLDAGIQQGLDSALLDRLRLTPERIAAMATGCREIAALPDPIGEITDLAYRPSGIQVGRMRVPLGVIGIIFESRPNVTIDAAALCLKSGNACILRGGSEAFHSNQALAALMVAALEAVDLPPATVQVVATTDRSAVGELLRLHGLVDVIIPRGGKPLIERVSRESLIPVIKHLDGVCHVYLDVNADRDKALAVAINSKTQRFGTCNTMETLLVHEGRAADLLPPLAKALLAQGVELRGCEFTQRLVPEVMPATEQDWREEYLAPVLAVRVVASLEKAIDHINTYGSAHTDSIVTEDWSAARHFLRAVDSSSVMVNASTRFADGFEYGLGAEIGISTDKLHARGPVGLEGLTSQKFIVLGDGHVRT